jgi:hypothetical protein
MENGITFVALDAHKVENQVAMLLPGEAKALEWDCANRHRLSKLLLRRGWMWTGGGEKGVEPGAPTVVAQPALRAPPWASSRSCTISCVSSPVSLGMGSGRRGLQGGSVAAHSGVRRGSGRACRSWSC